MLNSPLSMLLLTRFAAACALLTGAMASAQSGGLAVGVGVSAPFVNSVADYRVSTAVGPVGVVNVGYRGGHGYRGGYNRGGYYRGGYYGGWGWGVGLGVGTGLLLAAPWYYPPATTVIIEQPPQTVVMPPAPLPAQLLAPLPLQPVRPEPVIYPRNGQTAQQLEADRQDCNRWATTQPAALNDSQVFMRAVDACMDGRGYTTK